MKFSKKKSKNKIKIRNLCQLQGPMMQLFLFIYLLHFMPSRYKRIPVTGLFPTVTCWVTACQYLDFGRREKRKYKCRWWKKGVRTGVRFRKSLGPIKLKWKVDEKGVLGRFVAGPSGRSLWIGAQILCDWKSRKYCKSAIPGLSARTYPNINQNKLHEIEEKKKT